MAHWVLPDTQANASQNQKSHFFPTHPNKKNVYLCRQKINDKTDLHITHSIAWFLFDTNADQCLW